MRRLQAAGGTTLTGPDLTTPEQPQRGPAPRLWIVLGIAAAVYVADVISKVVVVATLPPGHQVRLLGGLLTLLVVRNSGAAFSIGTSMTIVFTLIAAGVIFFILRTSRRLRSLPWAITLGLLLGGATGNLTDRLLRAPGVFRGDVVDWIELPHWPVFNVADSAIVCGGILAVLLSARGMRLDGTREGHPRPGGADEPGPDATGPDASGRDASGRDEAGPQEAAGPASQDKAGEAEAGSPGNGRRPRPWSAAAGDPATGEQHVGDSRA